MDLADFLFKNIGHLNDALTHYRKPLEYDNRYICQHLYAYYGKFIHTELNMREGALHCFNMANQHDLVFGSLHLCRFYRKSGQ